MNKDYADSKIRSLYQLYSDDIYRFIMLMVRDNQIAEDLTHDSFLKAYKHFDSLLDSSSEKSWIYSIARNVTIDFFRKKRPITWFSDLIYFHLPSNEPLPEQVIQLGEDEKQLYKALRRINRRYQEVIILRKIKEFSVYETSQVLGWSESKVKTTLFRGLKVLKEELQKEGYQHEIVR